jgi:hypothetical protein
MSRPFRLFPLAAAALAVALAAAPAPAQVPPPVKPLAKPLAAPSFTELDANRDGRVSLDEVLAYATQKSAAVKPFRIADVDLDGDGKLTQEELRKAGITGFEGMGTISARDLDISGDGYVTRQELDEFFARKHREAFARADADHDGSLRQSEFVLFRFK